MINYDIINFALNSHKYPETSSDFLIENAKRFKDVSIKDIIETEEHVNSWTNYISSSVLYKKIILKFINIIKNEYKKQNH